MCVFLNSVEKPKKKTVADENHTIFAHNGLELETPLKQARNAQRGIRTAPDVWIPLLRPLFLARIPLLQHIYAPGLIWGPPKIPVFETFHEIVLGPPKPKKKLGSAERSI